MMTRCLSAPWRRRSRKWEGRVSARLRKEGLRGGTRVIRRCGGGQRNWTRDGESDAASTVCNRRVKCMMRDVFHYSQGIGGGRLVYMVFADACAANCFLDEPESSGAYGLDSTEGWGRLGTRLGVGGAYMHFRHVLWGFPRIFTVSCVFRWKEMTSTTKSMQAACFLTADKVNNLLSEDVWQRL